MPNRSTLKGVSDSRSSEFLTYDPATNTISSAALSALSDTGVQSTGSEPIMVAKSWADVQPMHDALKAMGGGELHFSTKYTYTVPLGGKVSIDSQFVSLKFNRAKIDISAYCPTSSFRGDFGVIFYIYGSLDSHTSTKKYSSRVIEDGFIFGDFQAYPNTGYVTGPRVFMFDCPTALTSNSIQLNRMKIIGAYKGLSFRSRSYFVRVNDNTFIGRCWAGVYSEQGAEDWAEKTTFEDYVIAENVAAVNTVNSNIGFATFDTATGIITVPDHYLNFATGSANPKVRFYANGGTLPTGITEGTTYYPIQSSLTQNTFRVSATDGGAAVTLSGSPSGNILCNADASGNIFTFGKGSFDYNKQMFVLGNGTKIYLPSSCNTEQSYGNTTGQTLPPISLTGANTGIWGRGLLAFRNKNGVTTDPFFPSYVTVDNQSQFVDLEYHTTRGWARSGVTDPDAWVTGSTMANKVRVRFEPDGTAPTDVPSITSYSDTFGTIGLLRQGGDWLYNQILNITGKSGTAANLVSYNVDTVATTSVGGTPATITRKSGRTFTAFKNNTPGTAAKYYITLPVVTPGARHAWSFFYNTQAVTGSVVIREMVGTFAPKFDGTNATWGVAIGTGVSYTNPTGITVTGASDWRRHSWKDHTSSVYPSLMSATSTSIVIEIDMTNATGEFMMSHLGYDVLTN